MVTSKQEIYKLFKNVNVLSHQMLRVDDMSDELVKDWLFALYALTYELTVLKSKKIPILTSKDVAVILRDGMDVNTQDEMVKVIAETLELLQHIQSESRQLIIYLLS